MVSQYIDYSSFTFQTSGQIYHRKVYSFLDMLGDVGGLSDGLFIIFRLFLASYSAFLYKSDLISSTSFYIGG